jgi:hypothetical protein
LRQIASRLDRETLLGDARDCCSQFAAGVFEALSDPVRVGSIG